MDEMVKFAVRNRISGTWQPQRSRS